MDYIGQEQEHLTNKLVIYRLEFLGSDKSDHKPFIISLEIGLELMINLYYFLFKAR